MWTVYSLILESSKSIFSFSSNKISVTQANIDMMLMFELKDKHLRTFCHNFYFLLQEIFLSKKIKTLTIIEGS